MFRVCAPGRDTLGEVSEDGKGGTMPKQTIIKKRGIKREENQIHTDKAGSFKFPTCERMTEAGSRN